MANWLPAANDLYLRMKNLYIASGNVNAKGVLWWQGESDALAARTQAAYHADLVTLAAQIGTDFGCKLFPCRFQSCSGIIPADQAKINDAIVQSWSDVANIAPGPDLFDLAAEDGFHLMSDAKIQAAAARWWTAIRTEFGW